MKNLGCVFLAAIVLLSCTSKNNFSDKNQEIALATMRVGEQNYNSGNYTAALKNLLEAYEVIPDNPFLNNSLGLVYLAKERADLAQIHFEKAVDLDPDYIRAKNNLGAAYMKQQKWDQAITCFEAVSQNLLYATPEVPFSNLGWVYFHQKMYEKAQFYFKKALDLQPDFLIAVHGQASVLIEAGNFSQAVDFLHQSLKRDPGAAILHSDLGRAYEANKDLARAIKSWETVLKLVPETSPLAREARKKLAEVN